MSSSFRSAKKDDDDVESLVGTTKYAGGAGLQKWDKAVLVDLGTGEQQPHHTRGARDAGHRRSAHPRARCLVRKVGREVAHRHEALRTFCLVQRLLSDAVLVQTWGKLRSTDTTPSDR